VSPAVPACWLAELPDPAEPVPLAAGVLLPELHAATVKDKAANPAAAADRAVRRLVNICIMVNPLG
jgi:hypothetical protein